ncbi:MAG: hypothetical protein KFB93_04355 [Simkaniaceae bacterium]|nr:MAG: hypothetical protein KFB93_04355 [Simkaniaceae bacterium]
MVIKNSIQAQNSRIQIFDEKVVVFSPQYAFTVGLALFAVSSITDCHIKACDRKPNEEKLLQYTAMKALAIGGSVGGILHLSRCGPYRL